MAAFYLQHYTDNSFFPSTQSEEKKCCLFPNACETPEEFPTLINQSEHGTSALKVITSAWRHKIVLLSNLSYLRILRAQPNSDRKLHLLINWTLQWSSNSSVGQWSTYFGEGSRSSILSQSGRSHFDATWGTSDQRERNKNVNASNWKLLPLFAPLSWRGELGRATFFVACSRRSDREGVTWKDAQSEERRSTLSERLEQATFLDIIQSVTQATRKKNSEFPQQESNLWPSAHGGLGQSKTYCLNAILSLCNWA